MAAPESASPTAAGQVRRPVTSALFVIVAFAGFAAGLLIGQRARPAPVAVESPTEISVSRPDPADPTGFSSVRIKVKRTGTESTGAGVQQPDEFGVVLWYAGEPRKSVHYFGAP